MSEAPKRYKLVRGDPGYRDQMCVRPDGNYILAAEHERIVAEMRAEIARLTAERDTIAALTVERCAEVAKVGWVSADYDLVGIADADMAMKLCEHIAAAIRSLSPIPPHVAALEEAAKVVGLNAWKHGGEDAYSQGMDAGARHQNKADVDAIQALAEKED